MEPSEFNAIYWGAQPLPVQALSGMERMSDARAAKAYDLVAKGFTVDPDIMMRGGDPYWTMFNRLNGGYTWVYGLGTQITNLVSTPGIIYPGVAPYDPKNPPAGSCKVSLDPADYPQVAPPPPPAPPPVEGVEPVPFWPGRVGGFCEANPLDHSPDGTQYGGPEGHWVKSVAPAFGSGGVAMVRQYWMKVGA